MSAYADDPRVVAKSASGNVLVVDLSGSGFDEPGLVWLRGGGTWVASREHGSYRDFPAADEAIRSLIGDPT